MSDRWNASVVSAESALLLLPALGAVRLGEDLAGWDLALEHYGATRDPAAPTAVVADAGAAVRSGCPVVLLVGPGGAVLRQAGYRTTTWAAVRTSGGATALVPMGDAALRRYVRTGGSGRRPWRGAAVDAAHAVRGRAVVTLASRGATRPAVLVAAGCTGRVVVVGGGGSARRRTTLLVTPDGAERPETVVKAGRLRDEPRAVAEQTVLGRLRDAGVRAGVPVPLGAGTVCGVAWSAESSLPGRPLSDVLARSRPAEVRRVLSSLVALLRHVGVRTRRAARWSPADVARVGLVGPHTRAGDCLSHLAGVPAIVAHGDLASGFNVLVDGSSAGIVDWETADADGLPLADLLPTLAIALAAARGARDPRRQAQHVLALCAGEAPDSPWFLDRVREHLHALEVPPEAGGRLAALALERQAALRLRHQEELAAAGDPLVDWDSPWDEVAAAWYEHPRLGVHWSALSGEG